VGAGIVYATVHLIKSDQRPKLWFYMQNIDVWTWIFE
jgi:hypothetical protein